MFGYANMLTLAFPAFITRKILVGLRGKSFVVVIRWVCGAIWFESAVTILLSFENETFQYKWGKCEMKNSKHSHANENLSCILPLLFNSSHNDLLLARVVEYSQTKGYC